MGNCDEFIYLGGNEQATHKYVSELPGKETIDASDYSRMYGWRGHYTRNDRIQARDLLTVDEVRMLDNRFALLFIRGERPVKDFKYDLMKHPQIGATLDGKAPAYSHGSSDSAKLTIGLSSPLRLKTL